MEFQQLEEDWLRFKNYLHFDNRISEAGQDEIKRLVSDSGAVARHSFYPLIRYLEPKVKFFNDAFGKRRIAQKDARPICYASHKDAQIYSYYAHVLGEHYERALCAQGIEREVLAFRKLVDSGSSKAKCNIHLANDAFEDIKRLGTCEVFAYDVQGFFDNLDPKVLKTQWKETLGVTSLPEDHYNIFRSLVPYAFVEQKQLYEALGIPKSRKNHRKISRLCSPEDFRNRVRAAGLIRRSERGIPQGTPISAVLANIYMLPFDRAVAEKMRELGGKYYRYCDDILCMVPPQCGVDVGAFVEQELLKVRLTVNSKKTCVSKFFIDEDRLRCDKPIQYLGFVFDGQRKCLRPASISKYRSKVKRALKLSRRTRDKFNLVRKKKGLDPRSIYLKQIYRRFSHVGSRTFVSYGKRAAKVMNSESIRSQLKKLDAFLRDEITNARAEGS